MSDPKPKVRPVTRWAVIYANPNGGWNIGSSLWIDKESVASIEKNAQLNGVKARAIRVRIVPVEPVPPRKKAKKGAGR